MILHEEDKHYYVKIATRSVVVMILLPPETAGMKG